jgi:GGDEF domain-containing protein
MESAVRDSDTVSRHSGDAFVILLAEISYQSDVALIATKMLSAIGASSENAPAGTVSASIGIAIFPQDGENATTLVMLDNHDEWPPLCSLPDRTGPAISLCSSSMAGHSYDRRR